MSQIALIEEDSEISELISWELRSIGHDVTVFENSEAGLDYISKSPVELAIVAPEMFGMPPRQLAASLRRTELRVLMLLDVPQSADELGADETIVKPFSIKELLTKVKKLLRKRAASSEASLTIGEISLDTDLGLLQVKGGAPQSLAPKEVALLELLMENPGVPASKDSLLREIWGFDTKHDESIVTSTVSRLNKLMQEAGASLSYIRSSFGVGYRLLSSEEAETGIIADDFFDEPEE